MKNLFRKASGSASEELAEELYRAAGCRIERIVSRGHASAPGFWYDQAEHEWVAVLTGRAGVRIEGEDSIRELGPGDWLAIPAHVRHRVEWTEPGRETVWLAIFSDSGGERWGAPPSGELFPR